MKKIESLILCLFIVFLSVISESNSDLKHWKLILEPRKVFQDTTIIDSLIFVTTKQFIPMGLECPDSVNWATFSSGGGFGISMIRTSNSGNSWYLPLDNYRKYHNDDIYRTAWPTPNFILISILKDSLIRSKNSGISWDTVVLNKNIDIYGFKFLKNGSGLCYGYNNDDKIYEILKTNNYGTTWDKIYYPSDSSSPNNLMIINDSTYTFFSPNNKTNPKIYYFNITSDFGKTWSMFTTDTGYHTSRCYFSDSKNGWIAATSDTNSGFNYKMRIYKTINGGRTWVQKFNDILYDFNSFSDIDFKDSLKGAIATKSGYIYRTSDGGESWILDSSYSDLYGNPNYLYIRYITDKRMVGLTYGGNFFLYDEDGFPEADVQESPKENIEFSLSPNPVIDYCDISFEINEPFQLKINLYNAFGQNISSPSIELTNAGLYSKRLDLSFLPPGIYFLVINTGKESLVRKFVKVE
jgi:hypothetical protein